MKLDLGATGKLPRLEVQIGLTIFVATGVSTMNTVRNDSEIVSKLQHKYERSKNFRQTTFFYASIKDKNQENLKITLQEPIIRAF